MAATEVTVLPVGDRAPFALELPEGTSFDEWVAIGRRLCLGRQALNWQIGDWWAFGDHRYGERARTAAEGLFGREFQTLMNLASVSRRFETSRRRETLSFTHHAEVVALPPSTADELLDKAEREHLSVGLVRREVRALKAANDPQRRDEAAEHGASPVQALKSMPSQSARADLLKAYEMVIEFAEALAAERKLSRREQDMLTVAEAFVREARTGTATEQPPEDFDVIFREKGRLACEEHYRVSRITVNHWLIARGKKRLIDERAAYVRFQRDKAHEAAVTAGEPQSSEPIDERVYELASQAAHFLRTSRYGGWRVSPTGDGGWFVGTVRKTSDELIAMAERQGFDSTGIMQSLQAMNEREVEG